MRITLLFSVFAFAIADLGPVDFIRNKFYTLETELWDNVTNPSFTETGLGDVELTKTFLVFDDHVDAIPHKPRPPLDNTWWWKKPLIQIQIVDGLYETFIDFLTRQAVPGSVPSPIKEWIDLAENILVDVDTSVIRAVKQLEDSLSHGDMFRRILQEEHPDLCELQMSPHQLIYDMYNTISLTEIKGYAMMQFSWMLLRVYGKGNFTREASLTRQRYGQRTNQTAAAAKSALALAKRGVYRCEPEKYKSGVNYAEVTRLLQGYIENEVDMNTDGTCKENCAHYTLAYNHGCFADQFCKKQQTCKGRIIDCKFMDSDMWVCQSSNIMSNRRYEWIEYEDGRTLGNVGHCESKTKVDSWWRWLFWHCSYCLCLCDDASYSSDRYFSLMEATADVKNNKLVDSWWKWNLLHCSYCFCLCEDEPDASERFFSMAEALADVQNNKVITGLRLVKYGRVFHLEITEGKLGERGAVTAGSTAPLRKFDPTEKDLIKNTHYHMLTYESRAIDLDELDSPAGHVLTGVRFRLRGAHLHFEIRSTPFNYATGRLNYDKSHWIENDNTDGSTNPRKKLELVKPDIPTRRPTLLPVDSTHDQYLEFTHTDFDADAAQSTVPFVDIQNVLPMKGASLISGAGIIHRGASGSGGFIATKLITYDFSKHVQAETPNETPSYNTEDDTTDFVPIIN